MYVIIERQANVGILTLNHGARRNALCHELVEELLAAMAQMEQEKMRVLILTAGVGASVWSAGHDIDELALGEDPLRYSDPLEQLIRAIRHFPAPVIAMVSGSVWGGATDLVLSCDLVIGDESCTFAITPVNLGLPYNTAGTLNFMRRLPLNLAKEMIFTARSIDAEEALAWHILNHRVASAQLEPYTLALARDIARKAPLAVAAIKEQLRMLGDSAPLQPGIFERIQELRHNVYRSRDYVEGIRAFQEKRPPEFIGE